LLKVENIIMKKISLFLLLSLFVFSAEGVLANESKPAEPRELTAEQQARLNQISRRVEEIRAMDFRSLNRSDRQELKNELKELKKEAKVMKGGVYLSVGAIIIIILVLILIL
jgi:hypothetical protein